MRYHQGRVPFGDLKTTRASRGFLYGYYTGRVPFFGSIIDKGFYRVFIGVR